jgi:hypothetical protein
MIYINNITSPTSVFIYSDILSIVSRFTCGVDTSNDNI